jgi:biopolymer transport protein ExbB
VLLKYRLLEKDNTLAKDQKLSALQAEVEESTSLELPALEENLVILSTITSLATLMGLLGTVLGMIRAFAALANAGAPDSVALASGISEALVNTAFGIGTAALAMIFYNYFTTRIDKLTYNIDEAGFSLVQSYATNHA